MGKNICWFSLSWVGIINRGHYKRGLYYALRARADVLLFIYHYIKKGDHMTSEEQNGGANGNSQPEPANQQEKELILNKIWLFLVGSGLSSFVITYLWQIMSTDGGYLPWVPLVVAVCSIIPIWVLWDILSLIFEKTSLALLKRFSIPSIFITGLIAGGIIAITLTTVIIWIAIILALIRIIVWIFPNVL